MGCAVSSTESQRLSLWWDNEAGGTIQGLIEDLLLQFPVRPIFLGLAVDLHVSIARLDFIKHSAKRKEFNSNHVSTRPEANPFVLDLP